MEIQLNEFHKKAMAENIQAMAYWRKHPLSPKAYLNQFKLLREQRLAKNGISTHKNIRQIIRKTKNSEDSHIGRVS